MRRGRRRTVPPDLVDQALVRYDLSRTQEQDRENCSLLAPPECESTFTDLGLKRTEDPEAE